ncbi:MAG: hypothetical protein H0V44_03565 [Planctomycetes bacterium]|nr:hypothetical protein [Planctomycetota bacterium]
MPHRGDPPFGPCSSGGAAVLVPSVASAGTPPSGEQTNVVTLRSAAMAMAMAMAKCVQTVIS